MTDMLRPLSARLCIAIIASVVLFGSAPVSAQDRIYVSSTGSDEVRVYDAASGEFVRTLFSPRVERQGPQEVVFGPDGMVYVTFFAGEESHVIHRYDPVSGDYAGAFSSGYNLDAPTKMRIGPDGNFHVSQWGESRFNVAVFDGTTGQFIREATSDNLRLNLMDMAWDDEGRLFVSHWGDGSNGFVRRIDASGNATTVIGSAELDGPVNLWFNEDGTLNVVDWTRARVEAYDVTTGAFVRTRASGLEGLSRFEGWTIGPDGLLYVCDWLQGKVNRYDPDTGALIDTLIDDPALTNPNSIKFGPAMDIATEDDATLPSEPVLLGPNHPNPFSGSTSISYQVDRDMHVHLAVFDLFGREVTRLVDAWRPAGEHSVSFLPGELPSGLYLYRLRAGSTTESRVMTFIR